MIAAAEARTLNEVFLALINQMPAIIGALAALVAAVLGYFNRKSVVAAAGSAEAAATKADEAAVRAEETHTVTKAIAEKTDRVAAQTDGHLSKLTEQVNALTAENVAFQKTIGTLVNILTAQRVAQASAEHQDQIVIPAVRAEDLAQAVTTVAKIEDHDASIHVEDLTQSVKSVTDEPVANPRRQK